MAQDQVSRAKLLIGIGLVFCEQDARAEPYLREVVAQPELPDNTLLEARSYLIKVLLRTGRRKEGLREVAINLRRARRVSDLAMCASACADLSLLVTSRKARIRCLELASDFAQRARNSLLVAPVSESLGGEYLSLGLVSGAQRFYEQAIDVYEQARAKVRAVDRANMLILDWYAQSYDGLAKCLVRQGKTIEALLAMESGRARALNDAIYGQPAPALDLRELQSLASKNAAAFVFLSDQNKELWVWTITGQHVEFNNLDLSGIPTFHTPVIIDMDDLAYQFLTEFASPITHDCAEDCGLDYLHRFYDLIIRPIEGQIAGCKWLVFVPDSHMSKAPFTAFLSAEHRHLIDDYCISVAPSLTTFVLLTDFTEEPQPIANLSESLVIGNPRMPMFFDQEIRERVRLEPLPASEEEAVLVASLLGASPLIGCEATIDKFTEMASNAPVIHLATHSIWFEPTQPSATGNIALAPTDASLGILSHNDIATMTLNCQFCMLNLCRSADGWPSRDGSNGLTRAFIAAGAQAVVGSIPDLSDFITKDFAYQFYLEALFSKAPVHEAFRSAVLQTKVSNQQVHAWGGFLLTCGANRFVF